jgi:ankyrin repeat protein
VVLLLLVAAAAVDAADLQGFTALHIAAQNGHVAVVQHLLGAHAAVEPTNVRASHPCMWRPLRATIKWCSCCWVLEQQLMPPA